MRAYISVLVNSSKTSALRGTRGVEGANGSTSCTGTALMVTLALLAPVPVLAKDDPAVGAAIALQPGPSGRPACAACHGADGAGQPDVGIPRLAGLHASYMADQLGHFATGVRANAIMAPYAASLSADERRAVAEYFAALPIPAPVDPIPEPVAKLDRGMALFQRGDARTGLIACTQCHGPNGVGVGSFTPRLAGQSGPYIAEQLHNWHAGDVRDPRGAYMRAIAARLPPTDIEAVAAYAAGLKASETIGKTVGGKP